MLKALGVMRDGHRRRSRILIVEDDASLAHMYRTALRFEGFDVHVVSDGLSALSWIDHDRPDLVVLDLHLPQLRGEAILSEIQSRRDMRDTRIVVVTGSDPQPVIAQATAILRKPCAPERLLSVITRQLSPLPA
jgi:DNA-binding response OmpR family regulator